MTVFDGTDDVVVANVRHYRQHSIWDCGISCVMMLYRYVSTRRKVIGLQSPPENVHDTPGKSSVSTEGMVSSPTDPSTSAPVSADSESASEARLSYEDLKALVGTESIWTIDLVHLIVNTVGLKCSMQTITIGVDMGFAEYSFYKKEFVADEVRVSRLFAQAEESGIPIVEKPTTHEDVVGWLTAGCVLLVLVSKYMLDCHHCHPREENSSERKVSWLTKLVTSESAPDPQPAPSTSSVPVKSADYIGHFVLLLGMTRDKKYFVYIDPDTPNNRCYTLVGTFHEARCCHGTDEDVIVIPLKDSDL